MRTIPLILLACLAAMMPAAEIGLGPVPAGSSIYSGGAAPANTYVVVSNGTTMTGYAGFTSDASGNVSTNTLTSSVATGTAPLTVTSTTWPETDP